METVPGLRAPKDKTKEAPARPEFGRAFLRKRFDPPKIDRTVGEIKELDGIEARTIRQMYKDGAIEEILALDFKVSEEIIEKVLEGEVWPYSGGPLRLLPVNGLNPLNGFTPNQRLFMKSVIRLAKVILSDRDFTTLCEFNALTYKQGDRICRDKKVETDEQVIDKRISRVLRLHHEGTTLEECFLDRHKGAVDA